MSSRGKNASEVSQGTVFISLTENESSLRVTAVGDSIGCLCTLKKRAVWQRRDDILISGIKQRLVIITLLLIVLLVMPIFAEIYHLVLYYIGISLLILYTVGWSVINWDKDMEAKFYESWQKKRSLGFWLNVARIALSSFARVAIIIGFSQYFVNGNSILQLEPLLLLTLIALLLAISVIIGIVSWYEHEKRFIQIINKSKNFN